MTDYDILSRVLACIDPTAQSIGMIRRNGHWLLGLPQNAEAARRALGLYQPQRRLARLIVAGVQGLARMGMHRCVLSRLRISCESSQLQPPLRGIEQGTCGILLGSPEHQVRRAIASYRNAGEWEVAKISFGEAGARVLEQEARVLEELQAQTVGVPDLLGFHRGDEVTVLRMPYLTGQPISEGESTEALRLLGEWVSDQEPQSICAFPEWAAIESCLSETTLGAAVLGQLADKHLRPVICHGDFARWNLLRQPDGSLVVLDWEWGHKGGMPGIDLVHYFLQDARLVQRLSPANAIRQTLSALEAPVSRAYLEKTGWRGATLVAMTACLAYKQGSGHQDNTQILEEILHHG